MRLMKPMLSHSDFKLTNYYSKYKINTLKTQQIRINVKFQVDFYAK